MNTFATFNLIYLLLLTDKQPIGNGSLDIDMAVQRRERVLRLWQCTST